MSPKPHLAPPSGGSWAVPHDSTPAAPRYLALQLYGEPSRSPQVLKTDHIPTFRLAPLVLTFFAASFDELKYLSLYRHRGIHWSYLSADDLPNVTVQSRERSKQPIELKRPNTSLVIYGGVGMAPVKHIVECKPWHLRQEFGLRMALDFKEQELKLQPSPPDHCAPV